MLKITKKNWLLWLSAAVLIAVLEYGFSAAVRFKGLESSDAAGWMQAIGSVFAIVAAGAGISAQLADADARSRQNADDEKKNLLKALAAEVRTYRINATAIKQQVDSELDTYLSGILRMVYPEVEHRFAVYTAIAPKLGLIEDDQLRAEVIALYASFDTLFSLMNRNSKMVIAVGEGKVDQATEKKLQGFFSAIQQQLDAAVELAEQVSSKLDQAAVSSGPMPVPKTGQFSRGNG